VRDAVKTDDVNRMRRTLEALQQASMKLGETMYAKPADATAAQPAVHPPARLAPLGKTWSRANSPRRNEATKLRAATAPMPGDNRIPPQADSTPTSRLNI